MRPLWYGLILLGWLATHCTPLTDHSGQNQELLSGSQPSDEVSIDLEPWLAMAQGGSIEVSHIQIVNDPLFKSTKTYRALPLSAVLDSLLSTDTKWNRLGIIQFVCKDGYAPTDRLRGLPLEAGWLAFHDTEAPGNELWTGKQPEQYGPFYLVWGETVQDRKKVSWPWGLTALKLSVENPHAAIMPRDHAKALKGFRLYEQRCIKCHSINKVGGLVGPELNYPKSITEYLDKEIIWQYTKDPRSFRYNSKMHGTGDITREEFELIYDYLSYMKGKAPADDAGA